MARRGGTRGGGARRGTAAAALSAQSTRLSTGRSRQPTAKAAANQTSSKHASSPAAA